MLATLTLAVNTILGGQKKWMEKGLESQAGLFYGQPYEIGGHWMIQNTNKFPDNKVYKTGP